MVKITETIAKIDPERSRVMRAVKGADTGPERIVRRALHAEGVRYRLQVKDLPGKPDILLPSRRLAVFVHGCFWHGHPGCPRHRLPKTRTDYWSAKIERNKGRDIAVKAALEILGWRILVIWECEVRDPSKMAAFVQTVREVPIQSRMRRS